jgi:hypothetical protein
MTGRERAIFAGAARGATATVAGALVSSSRSSATTKQGRSKMQERKQTINGYDVTVLVNDEDVEAFDAAQKEADAQRKSRDSAQNKARKSVADKSS